MGPIPVADVRPFRALRYDVAKLADPGVVLAPPFDVISAQQQRQLYESSAHNIVRLESPLVEPGGDPYAAAATALAEWTVAGVMARDTAPALYAYEQRFQHDGVAFTRHALFTRVRVEPWEAGIVLPHEYTRSRDKEDRLQLIRACRTNISPVYGLYRDETGAMAALLGGARADPLFEGRDILGHGHRLWRIGDDGTLAAVAAFFRDRRLYIADGHHRFETALNYRNEVKAARSTWTGGEPENFVLMALTSVADPGLVVLPIHRLVHRPPLGEIRALLADDFELEDVPGLDQLLAGLAASWPNAFGFIGTGGSLHLLRPRGNAPVGRTPVDRPGAWRRLDVAVLQAAVLERCFGVSDADMAAGEAVTYTEGPQEALEAVQSGRATYAFLLNGTRVEEILAVADAGERMPQKSTYFYPKLGTGLVLNSLD
ncbi:MAG: DUF1015 domain-containing protein [Dehalococcoidia bacterium]|nr:DUF1015 domain-containing protein [Dehalococcoidia bacterium]